MARLLTGPWLTAVVATNDILRLGVYDALAAAELVVGGDVLVTGCSEVPLIDRIQHAAMGREGASLLLAEIAAPDAERQEMRLLPELVVRASAAPVTNK